MGITVIDGVEMTDLHWMKKAYDLALKAKELGEVPVGAVLVSEDNQLVGQGYNAVIDKHDPTAHAEIEAIRQAASNLANYRLLNTTLYVTLEPCPMCAGALVHSRIKRLVFATRDFKSGAAGSLFNLVHSSSLNHKIKVDEGLMQHECAALLTDFFTGR